MFLIGIFTFDAMFFPLVSMLLGIYIIAVVTLEPFKESQQTKTYALFLCNLALVFTIYFNTELYGDREILILSICLPILAAVLPLLYISIAITLHWVYRHRKFRSQLIRRLYAWRHGYETL